MNAFLIIYLAIGLLLAAFSFGVGVELRVLTAEKPERTGDRVIDRLRERERRRKQLKGLFITILYALLMAVAWPLLIIMNAGRLEAKKGQRKGGKEES